MYRLFKIWLYVKILFEVLEKFKNLIGKLLKVIIRKNVFTEENATYRKNNKKTV